MPQIQSEFFRLLPPRLEHEENSKTHSLGRVPVCNSFRIDQKKDIWDIEKDTKSWVAYDRSLFFYLHDFLEQVQDGPLLGIK